MEDKENELRALQIRNSKKQRLKEEVLAAVLQRRRNSLPVIVGLSNEAKEQGDMEDGELANGQAALHSESSDSSIHAQHCPQCDSAGVGDPVTNTKPADTCLAASESTLAFMSPTTRNTLASFEARCSGIDSLIRQHAVVHAERAGEGPGL